MEKEMFLRMTETEFIRLPKDVRDKFTYVEVRETNEYETHKDDPKYMALWKHLKDAKTKLQEYLFNKRHGLH